MSTATANVLHGWPTRRFELMRTLVCELPVQIEGSVYEGVMARVQRDLLRRGLEWFPPVYLSTGWHCPDRVPLIGVPFSMATRELRRIEKEVTNRLDPQPEMIRLLRHEVGHAYNYAMRLYETPEWRRLFGPFSRPYRHHYVVRPSSRQHVRHLENHYAQKHPDEDFAETFAVWLTPRTQWRTRYEGWGALKKLEYVDRVMREARGFVPAMTRGARIEPIERLRYPLAQHYQRLGYDMGSKGYDVEAAGYVDQDLRLVFRGPRLGGSCRADETLRRLRRRIVDHVVQMLQVRPNSAQELYDKYVARAADLGIQTGRDAESRLLVGVTSMMTTHLLNLKHTGRFMPLERLVSCR
jgi:hypothetical protein